MAALENISSNRCRTVDDVSGALNLDKSISMGPLNLKNANFFFNYFEHGPSRSLMLRPGRISTRSPQISTALAQSENSCSEGRFISNFVSQITADSITKVWRPLLTSIVRTRCDGLRCMPCSKMFRIFDRDNSRPIIRPARGAIRDLSVARCSCYHQRIHRIVRPSKITRT